MHGRTIAALAISAAAGLGALVRSSGPADACSCESAPARTRVEGVVLDRGGHVVAGAAVVARPAKAEHTADPLAGAVLTDRDGRFHIDGLAPGEYTFVSVSGGAGGAIAATPDMPVVDRLAVTISFRGEATGI